MRVLVLGGTGWVGHHIVRELQAAGHAPVVCSRGHKSTYCDDLPDGVPQVVADKSVAEDMARVLAEPFDAVIDSVPTEASIGHVVQFAPRLKRYLHCSSTGGYAPLPVVPGDETLPYDEFMGGWAQKGIVDSLVLDLHHRQGFPATVIRPSYITGPGMLPLDNLGGRRQDFLADVLAGKTLELPNDGQALLHPVHVRDLARAFALALETPQSVGQIYNICLDRAVPLTRYLAITAQALNAPEPTIDFQPVETILARHGDSIHRIGLHFLATHMCYDIRKAREQLGYRPSMSTEEAIEETARWGGRKLGLMEAVPSVPVRSRPCPLEATMNYTIHRIDSVPALDGNWDAPVWQRAETLTIANARPESSAHRPTVEARLLHDGASIFGIYRVQDRYVRAVQKGFQAPVCRDSCVEFFFQPHAGPGYFNFEFSAGGAFLCSYIRDCTRIGEAGFADFELLGPEAEAAVPVYHSLPETIDPEITEPTTWTVQFLIPVCMLETYAGHLGSLHGRQWTANFYKCGDETSHPHWLSWAPVDELNFHLPRCFQPISFE